ncbi:PucR family transcriptional regulator [Microtetraspora malaysiensis]|uniref:PucR family transcriptional regulator n=1 Tax=Microtetraspora malaysiensis TaxID=161358 RepID=A0ABW6T1S6_9ACTN
MLTPVIPRHVGDLGRILNDLGATLLDLVHGDPDCGTPIGGVAMYDPFDDLNLPPHAIVLGVALRQPQDIVALLRRLGAAGACALVVRAPVQADDGVRAAATGSGVALLGLTRGASWTQLAVMLRSLLAEADVGAAVSDGLAGIPAGDLFAVANALSALLDAPLTIEDRGSRVLAFSERQEEADESRIETVLGRQVPERYLRMLDEQGVFAKLYASERPVFFGLDGYRPRVALAIRAGEELLGSIWAVVPGPLSEEREQALVDAGKLVALHMLRHRAGADVERRLMTDLVATALEGGTHAAEALGRLRLDGWPLAVLAYAVQRQEDHSPAQIESARRRACDAFALHMSAVQPGAAVAMVGGVVYALLPVRGPAEEAEPRSERVAAQFLDRIDGERRGVIGIGRLAGDAGQLAQSRADADRALRVLQSELTARQVAHVADVQVEALLLELSDLTSARHDQPIRPVQRLREYDGKHQTELLTTLRAWLDAFGDVNEAAAAVHIHPSTFRYRLRRVAEIASVDLGDPDTRFALMLQLRMLGR